MHTHFLDPYEHRDSLIHMLDARVKLVLAVAFILTTSLTPAGAWPVYALLLAISISVVVISDLGIAAVLKRASIAIPFALAALPVLFTVQGAPIYTLPIDGITLTISNEGLERFISILLKSFISVQVAIVLAGSTPFTQLLMAMRAVKIPRLLVAIFGLMWRYLFVLADEVTRLLRARASRSGAAPQAGRKPGGALTWRAKVAGGMAGNLFIRAFDRGDRIYAAMAARGYDGEVRGFDLPHVPAMQQIILVAGLFVLLCLFGLSRLFGA